MPVRGDARGAEGAHLDHDCPQPASAAERGGRPAPVVVPGERRQLGLGEEEDVHSLDHGADHRRRLSMNTVMESAPMKRAAD